jgi:Na+-translocating ferredoxin:NAD+ oxidoreductase RnfG subunit
MAEQKKKSRYKSLVKPTLTLVVIGALAYTFQLTAPTIAENQAKAEAEAARLVLGDEEGLALKTQVKSYGGKLELMVGVSEDGRILGVTILSHSDTPGLGTQPMEPDYLAQYLGLTELTGSHINEDNQVDAVTGATISSNANYLGIKQALADFQEKGGSQ